MRASEQLWEGEERGALWSCPSWSYLFGFGLNFSGVVSPPLGSVDCECR